MPRRLTVPALALALGPGACIEAAVKPEPGATVEESAPEVEARAPFVLPTRDGSPPKTSTGMPHTQDSDNSPEEIIRDLATWLFALPHVERRKSKVSMPSTRAAYIEDAHPTVNPAADREFTHIHTEPGPGSQHMGLPRSVAAEVIAKGWGTPHPLNDQTPGFELLLIYAPRTPEELEVVKRITTAAYEFAMTPGEP